MNANPLSNITKRCPALRLISTEKMPHENWLAVDKQGSGSPDAASIKGHAKPLQANPSSLDGKFQVLATKSTDLKVACFLAGFGDLE